MCCLGHAFLQMADGDDDFDGDMEDVQEEEPMEVRWS